MRKSTAEFPRAPGLWMQAKRMDTFLYVGKDKAWTG